MFSHHDFLSKSNDLYVFSSCDVKSFIYLCEKSRVQENDQNTFFFIDQSQTLNDYNCTFILTIHSTST